MAMALIIFTGTGMDVKAADVDYEIIQIDITEANLEQKLINTLEADDPWKRSSINDVVSEFFANKNITSKAIVFVTYDDEYAEFPFYIRCTYDLIPQGGGYTSLNRMQSLDQNPAYSNIVFYMCQKKHSTTENSSSNNPSPVASSSTPHTHSYSWVTVQEANAGQDGIEEYRCSCGDVQGRSIIPASEVFVKGLYGEIKNAPQNGTATFDSGRLYTISDYVIKKLAERTDVTTVITFEYQNQSYKMTIPAGADFTGLLADEDYFYGYFFFANAVGATIEAIA